MTDPVKLIAVDMDGTLLRSDKTVDPRTAGDIEAAVKHGIRVAYCTGRGIAEMRDIFPMLPMIRYAVCCSGAVIYDIAEDRIIYQNGLEHPLIGEIVSLAARYEAMPHFLTDRESIVSASDITHMADFLRGIYQPMFERIARPVTDMAEEGARHSSIAKINIYFRSEEDRKEGAETMRKLPLQVIFSENATLEMTAPATDKGAGLKQLAEFLRIPMEQTAAVGDYYNDIEMLAAAGFSAAMGNAPAEIKDRCNFVTADNDHNGVGEVIRFLLDKQTVGEIR